MKMNTKIFLFYLAITAMAISSCQKDTDIFIPDTTSVGLDTNWVSAVIDLSPVNEVKRLLRKEIVVDSIDAAAGGTFQTAEGLTVTVSSNSLLLLNNQPATGKIYVETLLITQRGDMVRHDKPTTSFGRVLISGGEVFIRLRKEKEELHLAPGKTISIKYNDSSPSSLMKLFYGDESNPERFNWLPTTLNSRDSVRVTSQGYEIVSERLRWINCDYFADSSGARMNIIASLPADFTNSNTSVYLVFKDIKSVVGMYGDALSKRFSSSKVPSGKIAVVISITKKGNNSYYLGYQNITTGQTSLNGNQVVPLKPQPTSITDIKAYLSTL